MNILDTKTFGYVIFISTTITVVAMARAQGSFSTPETMDNESNIARYWGDTCNDSSKCDSNLICLNQTCRCGKNQMYFAFKDHVPLTADSRGMCYGFSQVDCTEDKQCQDSDPNVSCDPKWNKCRCRTGYSYDDNTELCLQQQRLSGQIMKAAQHLSIQISKRSGGHLQKSKNGRFFELGSKCEKNSGCKGDFSHCYQNECRCWPGFRFRTIITSNDSITSNHEEFLENLGKCQPIVCQKNCDCQGMNGTDLICNGTVCQCPYGHFLNRDTRHCQPLRAKIPSCDLTCKTVGILFASIFIVTLFYWCFYCCLAVAKNIRPSQSLDIEEFERRIRSMEMPNAGRTLYTRNASLSASLLSLFLKNDKPPTFEDCVEMDEMLPPSYDSVLENGVR